MTNKVSVITTINPPNEKLRRYLDFGYDLLVVGDRKTDENSWRNFGDGVHFLSFDEQEQMFGKLSRLIGPNTYARKNFGYLHAAQMGYQTIFETDDDTFLRKEVGDPMAYLEGGNSFLLSDSVSHVHNPFDVFAPNLKSWPRGLPLSRILDEETYRIEPVSAPSKPVQIIQTLVNLEPDLDAIYRLTVGDDVIDIPATRDLYHLDDGVYSPGNTQSTLWLDLTRLPYMYFPVFVSNRFADILKMYVAQSCNQFSYAGFLTEQFRNPHDYMKDFVEEIGMYASLDLLIESLPGFMELSLSEIYEKLIQIKICDPAELEVVYEFESIAIETLKI
jgi:hypothetical protein